MVEYRNPQWCEIPDWWRLEPEHASNLKMRIIHPTRSWWNIVICQDLSWGLRTDLSGFDEQLSKVLPFPYYWTPSIWKICTVGSWALAIHAMWHLRRKPLESRNSEELIGIHLQFLGSPSEYHVLPCHHNKPSFLLGSSAQKWLHVITDIIPGLVNDLALRWFNGRPKPLKKAEPGSTTALLKGLQLFSLISWFVLDEIGPFAHGTFLERSERSVLSHCLKGQLELFQTFLLFSRHFSDRNFIIQPAIEQFLSSTRFSMVLVTWYIQTQHNFDTFDRIFAALLSLRRPMPKQGRKRTLAPNPLLRGSFEN